MTKCPACGYSEVIDNKPRHTIMNEYVSPDGKTIQIFNHFDKEIMVGPEGKQVKWMLKSVFDRLPKTPATPVTPAAK